MSVFPGPVFMFNVNATASEKRHYIYIMPVSRGKTLPTQIKIRHFINTVQYCSYHNIQTLCFRARYKQLSGGSFLRRIEGIIFERELIILKLTRNLERSSMHAIILADHRDILRAYFSHCHLLGEFGDRSHYQYKGCQPNNTNALSESCLRPQGAQIGNGEIMTESVVHRQYSDEG